MSEEGGLFAQANFAAVFAPLETAQALSGRADRVNDLVLRVRQGADIAETTLALERAFDGTGLAVTVMNRYDEDEVAEISEARVYPAAYFTVHDWACRPTSD